MSTRGIPSTDPVARNVSEPEIDALLARREEPTEPVVSRDFREPRRFSAGDLTALRKSAETTANAVLEVVKLLLPIEIAMEPIELGESSLDTAVREDGTEVVGAICEGGQGPSIVLLDAASAVAIAEVALGADEDGSPSARPLTPLERTLLDRLFVRVLERASQTLQLSVKDSRGFASRAALAREIAPGGDTRRVALRIPLMIGANRVVIHLLIAGIKVPAPKAALPTTAAKDARKPALPAEIAPTKVDVCAVLARTDILLTELLALEPGDVITLDAAPGAVIEIEVEGQPRARAHFGARDGRLAVRIHEILRTPPSR